MTSRRSIPVLVVASARSLGRLVAAVVDDDATPPTILERRASLVSDVGDLRNAVADTLDGVADRIGGGDASPAIVATRRNAAARVRAIKTAIDERQASGAQVASSWLRAQLEIAAGEIESGEASPATKGDAP